MRTLFISAFIIVLASCSNRNNEPDAYGNFETDEVIISSENNGQILETSFHEGDKVREGEVMAVIDTINPVLQINQLAAQRKAVLSQRAQMTAQIAVSEQQIINTRKNQVRIKNMLAEGASTPQQMDDINGQIDLFEKQKKTYIAQIEAIDKNASAVEAQIAVINEELKKAIVKAPLSGIILEKYAQTGELAVPGKPLYKMANIDSLILRIYISEPQLSQVKLGNKVRVMIDVPGGVREFPGIVEWVSSEAEFTPKIIQTREERVKLVYAVKVRVPNDGSLKIGMPGDVKFE